MSVLGYSQITATGDTDLLRHILDQCTAEVGGVGWRAAGVEQANENPDIYVHALLSQERLGFTNKE